MANLWEEGLLNRGSAGTLERVKGDTYPEAGSRAAVMTHDTLGRQTTNKRCAVGRKGAAFVTSLRSFAPGSAKESAMEDPARRKLPSFVSPR